MYKCKTWWQDLSRKKKIVWLLLGIAVSLLVLYFYSGCPAFTLEQKFRRAEKADLIGPSAILGIEEVEMSSYIQPVFVAEDETSVTLCGCPTVFLDDNTHLLHRKKTGELTLVVWPRPTGTVPYEAFEMPIFLFDDFPEAKRAELEFTLTWDEFYSRNYFAEAQRKQAGYFRFDVPCPATEISTGASGMTEFDSKEASLLFSLALASDYNEGTSRAQIPITVRLYDNQDALIEERILTVQSAAVDAHVRHNDPIQS